MKTFILLLLLVPSIVIAQGIRFEHGLTWNQLKEMAKQQNKYIFVDAYTTWCGPCKMMSSQVFTQEKVGNFFNENFINAKVQLDVTKNDNEDVKSWYKDAKLIETEYQVKVYPTFLFLNPEGKLVHRIVGASEADEFIAKSSKALKPSTQYYSQFAKYQSGEKDPTFLYNLAIASEEAYELENAAKIANEYLETQNNYFTKENAAFIVRFAESTTDKAFAILLENAEKFNQIGGNTDATSRLIGVIKSDEIFTPLNKKINTPPDWNLMGTKLKAKYPKYGEEALAGVKLVYYQLKADWINYASAVKSYMKQYSENATPGQMNDYAWTIFENVNDPVVLADAIEWSKRSFASKENPMYMDTYANLLYKVGKKEEAITWEQKAMDMVSDAEKSDYETTLTKMKKSEKTWK